MRRKQDLRKADGFTLVEVLIAAFLGAMVLLGITTLYINGLEFYDEGMSRLELQRQGSLAMEDMAREIRGGRPSPTSPNILGPDKDHLEVDIPTPEGGTDTIVYFRDEEASSLKFCRDVECNNEVTLIPSTVSLLRFTPQNLVIDEDSMNDAVLIELELSNDRGQRTAFQTTVFLRSPVLPEI